MPYGHIYTLRHEAVVATAITVLQLKAGATTPFQILEAGITQRLSVVSAQESICLVRKSTAATVTAAIAGTHLFTGRPGDPAADLSLTTTATGVIGTAEGTDTDMLLREAFNVLNGWNKIWVPETRPLVRAAGIIALKFLTAPASQTWDAWVTIMELG